MSLGLEISCTRSHSASSTFATIRKSFCINYLITIYPLLRILLLHQRIRRIMLESHVFRTLL